MSLPGKKVTPLQQQAMRLRIRRDQLRELQQVRNSVGILAPDTQAAWKTFMALAYRDLDADRSQVEMYSVETKEEREAVTAINKKTKDKLQRSRRIGPLYECAKCWDRGITDHVVLEGKERFIYCSCEKGVALARETPEFQAYELKRNIERRAKEIRAEMRQKIEQTDLEIKTLQWATSEDDESLLVCRYCRTGVRLARWEEGTYPTKHTGDCSFMPPEVLELVLKIVSYREAISQAKILAEKELTSEEK